MTKPQWASLGGNQATVTVQLSLVFPIGCVHFLLPLFHISFLVPLCFCWTWDLRDIIGKHVSCPWKMKTCLGKNSPFSPPSSSFNWGHQSRANQNSDHLRAEPELIKDWTWGPESIQVHHAREFSQAPGCLPSLPTPPFPNSPSFVCHLLLWPHTCMRPGTQLQVQSADEQAGLVSV